MPLHCYQRITICTFSYTASTKQSSVAEDPYVKVDTDEEADLATQLQIQGLPTLVFVGTDATKPALRQDGAILIVVSLTPR